MTAAETQADHSSYVVDASGFQGGRTRSLSRRTNSRCVEIIKAASESNIPLTIVGAGYGLTGGRVAQGGWVVSLEKFRRLEIHEGFLPRGSLVSLLDVGEAARPSGQFYAPDTTEINSSIGGTIATNASGSRSFRYGSTRRHVNAIRVALMDGRIVEYRRGDKIDFPVPAIPIPNVTKYTAGFRCARAWIGSICFAAPRARWGSFWRPS